MRAAVDTNVWVAALMDPRGPEARLMEAAQRGQFTVVCSRPLLAELEAVLQRPRIARLCNMTRTDISATTAYLRCTSYWVTVTGVYELCRDPEDNKVIETAVRGNAPIIVSRDSDLADPALEETFAKLGIRVLLPEDFLDELRAAR